MCLYKYMHGSIGYTPESKITTHRSLEAHHLESHLRRTVLLVIWQTGIHGEVQIGILIYHLKTNWGYIFFISDEQLLFFLPGHLTLSYENDHPFFQFEANCFGVDFLLFFLRVHLLNVQDLRGIQRSLAWRPRKRVAGPRNTTRGPAILGWPHWTSK